MIENDEQLQQTIEQLGRMYQVVAGFRAKTLPVNPRENALFAEGPLDEVAILQSDINAYLALNEPNAAPTASPETASDSVLQ